MESALKFTEADHEFARELVIRKANIKDLTEAEKAVVFEERAKLAHTTTDTDGIKADM